MIEKQFSNIFLRPLYQDKFPLNEIDKNNYDEVLYLSNKFCMPTTILNNLIYDSKIHNPLTDGLKKQAHISNLKKLINQRELLKISKYYNDNGIEHVFMKGSSINILCDDYVRYSRDLDILVSKGSLTNAYELLKEMGYRYHNPEVSDSSKFISQSHHLPVLSNGEGAFVELHHRVTKKSIYEQCPLTDLILKNHVSTIKNGLNIKISSVNHLIAHIVYHATLHHEFNLGPVFLYDINYLRDKIIDKKDLENLLDKMGLSDAFNDINKYLENRKIEDSFKLYKISKIKVSKNYIPKNPKYLLFTRKGNSDLLKIIIGKFKNNEDLFQTSKFSMRFYQILFTQLKNYIIKIYNS